MTDTKLEGNNGLMCFTRKSQSAPSFQLASVKIRHANTQNVFGGYSEIFNFPIFTYIGKTAQNLGRKEWGGGVWESEKGGWLDCPPPPQGCGGVRVCFEAKGGSGLHPPEGGRRSPPRRGGGCPWGPRYRGKKVFPAKIRGPKKSRAPARRYKEVQGVPDPPPHPPEEGVTDLKNDVWWVRLKSGPTNDPTHPYNWERGPGGMKTTQMGVFFYHRKKPPV